MVIQISTVSDLQNVNNDLTAIYELVNDIDGGGTDIVKLGSEATPFTGEFRGNNYTISNINIFGVVENSKGLFAVIGDGGKVDDLKLLNIGVSGINYCGCLAGKVLTGATITNCSIVNPVNIITDYWGNLIGYCEGTVKRCYASGGSTRVNTYCAGLIGYCNGATVSNCYSQCNVSATDYAAGFVAKSVNSTFTNCYCAGRVTVSDKNLGGFCVEQTGSTATSCYWDDDVAQVKYSALGTTKTTIEMQTEATFVDYDFNLIWSITASNYPTLIPKDLTLKPPLIGTISINNYSSQLKTNQKSSKLQTNKMTAVLRCK